MFSQAFSSYSLLCFSLSFLSKVAFQVLRFSLCRGRRPGNFPASLYVCLRLGYLFCAIVVRGFSVYYGFSSLVEANGRVSIYLFDLWVWIVLVGIRSGAMRVCGVIISFAQILSLVHGGVAAFYISNVRSYFLFRLARGDFVEFLSYLYDTTKCFPPSEYPHFHRSAFDS